MNKRIWVIILIILLLIGGFFIFSNKNPVDKKLISYAESCVTMEYPGARAFHYGGDPPCEHVYGAAFYQNNSLICNYLSTDYAKAICLGVSIEDWEDNTRCDSLSGENKEVCILNVLKKIYFSNYSKGAKGKDVCSNIHNEGFLQICKAYQSVINSDYSYCIEEQNNEKLCEKTFLELNRDKILTKNLCDDIFEIEQDKLNCYQSSHRAIEWTFLDELNFENILSDFDNDTRLTNHTIFTKKINIDSNFPYLVTYRISYLYENPYYVKGYNSPTLMHSESNEYICSTKIKSLDELENCLPFKSDYDLIKSEISVSKWSYGESQE